MGKISIFYNDKEIWGGVSPILEGQPTPFFSKSVDYMQFGERWAEAENWSLNGYLTGCDFDDLEYCRTRLLSGFSTAFGSIQISGNDETVFDLNIVEVQDISMDNSDYIGSLPFAISFLHYPSGSFNSDNHSGFYGVINPSDSITYTENPNGTMDMSRELSAKGFITNPLDKDSAINNAKSFIAERKTRVAKPFLIRNAVNENAELKYYLESSEESYNRITNEVKLIQKFKTDLMSLDGDIVHRYTINEEEAVAQMTVLSYNGQIDVGRYGDITRGRAIYKQFKASLAATFLKDEEITEDLYANKITYKLSFYKEVDENNFPQVQDDITISLKEDSNSSLFTASVQGGISANYGCLDERSGMVKAKLASVRGASVNYNYGLVAELYKDFYTTGAGSKQNKPASVFLNPIALSKSEDFDEFNKTSSYNAEFNDRFIDPLFAGCINFDMNVNINYSIEQRAVKEHYSGGKYICQCLGYNGREVIKASVNRDGVDTFKGKAVCLKYVEDVVDSFRVADAKQVYIESPSYSKSDYDKTEAAATAKTYNTLRAVSI